MILSELEINNKAADDEKICMNNSVASLKREFVVHLNKKESCVLLN